MEVEVVEAEESGVADSQKSSPETVILEESPIQITVVTEIKPTPIVGHNWEAEIREEATIRIMEENKEEKVTNLQECGGESLPAQENQLMEDFGDKLKWRWDDGHVEVEGLLSVNLSEDKRAAPR
ncbi:hypothetical protein R1sor_013812 [Riccia sorocarpa]|uniref:Uncharacterized protein n=1 Tax=Riccia sorocarpa TaxID=122646 RepID=A0ABD3H889_9MARC